MTAPPADLDPRLIATSLLANGARRIAGPVHAFAQLASTMDEARRLADAGAPEGVVVVADEQVDGRGRLGRAWTAPPGSSLLFTVLFRPPAGVSMVQVPMAVALGTLEAMRQIPTAPEADTSLAATLRLKWPNDFVAMAGRDRAGSTPPELSKVGGLLTEVLPGAGVFAPGSAAILVGVGLNVRQRESALPPGATSVARLGLVAADRGLLLAAILAAADRYYRALLSGTDLVAPWSHELATLGCEVTVETPLGAVSGVAAGVAADGALLVRDGEGGIHPVYAGDVNDPQTT